MLIPVQNLLANVVPHGVASERRDWRRLSRPLSVGPFRTRKGRNESSPKFRHLFFFGVLCCLNNATDIFGVEISEDGGW